MLVITLMFAAVFRSVAQTPPAASAPPYLNPSLPLSERVDDLVSRMTLEEKASQLVNQARAIPRLQVPAYDWWSEALHGVANAETATVFPEPIGLAATFDSALIHDMAIVIITEARAKHNQAVRAGRRDIMEGLDFWSPNINIFRDPRWGRGQETYGEDPFLTGRMGVAFVAGMQGDDPKYFRVIAAPKHYAVHSGPEPSGHMIDVKVSKHDEEDTYLPAFRAAIVQGKAASIMCAYNRVNGEPACANKFLLQDQLRGAWKFKGYVVSDCDAIADIFNGHHYEPTPSQLFINNADDLVLFFHHVPYTYKLHSGKTAIQTIYDSHYAGAEKTKRFVSQWQSLHRRIDDDRFHAVLAQLTYQSSHAIVWRDAINDWFHRISGILDANGRVGNHPTGSKPSPWSSRATLRST
jgi:beta-glucosidase-like glycosyl hydrolase